MKNILIIILITSFTILSYSSFSQKNYKESREIQEIKQIIKDNNNKDNKLHSAADTINIISKISFTISSSGWRTFEDLLINSNYRIIIDSSCNVELTWPGKCPNKDLMACSYFGKISRKEFEKLKKIIIVNNLLELKNVYDTEFSDNGVEIYKIIFNNNEEKIILDSDYHIKSLNRLRYMILKLKKNIIWKPDTN